MVINLTALKTFKDVITAFPGTKGLGSFLKVSWLSGSLSGNIVKEGEYDGMMEFGNVKVGIFIIAKLFVL